MKTTFVFHLTRTSSIRRLAIAALLAGAFVHGAHAQLPGSVDPSFQVGTGVGPSGAYLETVAVKPDGKIIIGGAFGQFNGVTRNYVAQLNADGSLDTTFNPGVGADGLIVFSVAVQSNGKVVIGGIFDQVDSATREHIAQLNTDGTVDTTFDPGTGTNGTVYSVAVQSDGKVLIGGEFTQINGVTSENIARLNTDGSVDTGFNSGTGAEALIYAMAVQSDGKIVVAGDFGQFNGVTRKNIARLNTDGSVDTTFDPGSGPDGQVTCVALQADGRIALGGYFNEVNGVVHNCIAQLNADGSVDPTFNPGIGANEPVFSVTVQGNGKLIVTGGFSQIDNVARYSIARLNGDGSVDPTFAPSLNAEADCAALQSDGKIVVGGSFGAINGVTLSEIGRLNGGDAPAITSFSPGSGPIGSTVTITGTGFVAPLSVIFGGNVAAVHGFTSTVINARVPSGAITGPIKVTTGRGSVSTATNFTVAAPPTITSFSPSGGAVGSNVVIKGTNFVAPMSVIFGGNVAAVHGFSSTVINATVPAGAITGPIKVTTSYGSASTASSFAVPVGPPTITSFSPASGSVGSTVTIRGTGFVAPLAVIFGGNVAAVHGFTSTVINAIVPGGAMNGVIRVNTGYGTASTASGFTVSP